MLTYKFGFESKMINQQSCHLRQVQNMNISVKKKNCWYIRGIHIKIFQVVELIKKEKIGLGWMEHV